jgi:hypothetical protein
MARIKEEEYMRRIAHRNQEEYDIDVGMSGTSCTLVLIIGNTVYFGFVGDSLVAVSKYLNQVSDQNTTNLDLILTKPWHTPEN